MLGEISFEQFLEWQVYDQEEPFGDRRGDWQSAAICATLANIAVARGRSRKRFKLMDFLLEFGEEKKTKEVKKSPKELKNVARFAAMMYNAMLETDEKKKRKR